MKKLSKEFWYISIIVILISIFSIIGDLMVLDITDSYAHDPQEIVITVRQGE